MPQIDVLPPALVSAAAAVRCFAVDLEPVVLRSDLVEGVSGFSARWASSLAALADDAEAVAAALREAAARYAEVDRLLVPPALAGPVTAGLVGPVQSGSVGPVLTASPVKPSMTTPPVRR